MQMTGHEAHRLDRYRLGERSYVDGDAITLEALHVIAVLIAGAPQLAR